MSVNRRDDRKSDPSLESPDRRSPETNQDSRAARGTPGFDVVAQLQPTIDVNSSSSEQDLAPILPVGHHLGSFRIAAFISSGGMGQVYRAIDERLDREVAIKILPRAFARDPLLLSRFQAEARAASGLNHPNIVAVHDIGREDDLCWIVSEFVDGDSLRQTMAAGQLTFRNIIEITLQISDGLTAAHTAGLIHRDLKPENIMLNREGRVKILDFGLAKSAVRSAAASSSRRMVTQVGVILGTPGYMSPEQIAGENLDQRSDIFSLGVILYEMLTDTRPFTGDDRMSIMHSTLTANPPPLPLSVPPALAKLTERCLEKKPEKRMQSAADVAFAMQMVASGSGTHSLMPRPRARVRVKGQTILLCAAALIAASGLLFAGWLLRPQPLTESGTVRHLTWDEGLTQDGAISPDGRMVAYASDRAEGHHLNIFLQQIEGGTQQLTFDSEENDEPNFSPDGVRVAFESRHGVGGIKISPTMPGEVHLFAAGGRHPRFSPDGRYLLYARTGSEASLFGGQGAQLIVQPLAGGDPVAVSRGCTEVVAQAVWSPDSRNVLTSATCDGQMGFWLLNIDGKSRRLTDGGQLWVKHKLNGALGGRFQAIDQWLTNPSRLLLSLKAGDISHEATVRISDDGMHFFDDIRPVDFGPSFTVQGSASEDGRVALTSRERSTNVYEISLDSSGRPINRNPIQVTHTRGTVMHPALSPDGQLVTYVLPQFGRDELQVLNLNGRSGVPSTLLSRNSIRHPNFTPDSRHITYQGDNNHAFQISVDGGITSTLLPNTTGYIMDWLPGKRIFAFLRTPDAPNIEVVDADTSAVTATLHEPGHDLYQPHFSPNGKYLVFNAFLGLHSRIYAAPLHPGQIQKSEWLPLTDGLTWDDKPRLSSDGRTLFYLSNRDGFPCIWKQRISPAMRPLGEPESVYHAHLWHHSISAAGIGDFELNVYRNKLVFSQTEAQGNIWIVDPPTDPDRKHSF